MVRNDGELGTDFVGASERPYAVGRRVLTLLHALGPSG